MRKRKEVNCKKQNAKNQMEKEEPQKEYKDQKCQVQWFVKEAIAISEKNTSKVRRHKQK